MIQLLSTTWLAFALQLFDKEYHAIRLRPSVVPCWLKISDADAFLDVLDTLLIEIVPPHNRTLLGQAALAHPHQLSANKAIYLNRRYNVRRSCSRWTNCNASRWNSDVKLQRLFDIQDAPHWEE